MGSVAAALRERGCTVTGSDEKVYPPMSDFLRAKGHPADASLTARKICLTTPRMVVVGNAIKRGNPEVEAVLNRKLYYLSLPEVLKEFFLRGRHNLVVTGTHGKTTTTRAADLDVDRRRIGAGLHDRRSAAQSRAGRAL